MTLTHQAPMSQGVTFPHMKDWLGLLDQDWSIPTPYLIKARKLRDDLIALPAQPLLLHGDLHHDNILKNGSDWLVIDPRGIVGSAIHETWTFIRNMEKDTAYVAQFFNFDIVAVRQWYFVHLIRTALWNIEDGAPANPFLELAEKAYAVIDGSVK